MSSDSIRVRWRREPYSRDNSAADIHPAVPPPTITTRLIAPVRASAEWVSFADIRTTLDGGRFAQLAKRGGAALVVQSETGAEQDRRTRRRTGG